MFTPQVLRPQVQNFQALSNSKSQNPTQHQSLKGVLYWRGCVGKIWLFFAYPIAASSHAPCLPWFCCVQPPHALPIAWSDDRLTFLVFLNSQKPAIWRIHYLKRTWNKMVSVKLVLWDWFFYAHICHNVGPCTKPHFDFFGRGRCPTVFTFNWWVGFLKDYHCG